MLLTPSKPAHTVAHCSHEGTQWPPGTESVRWALCAGYGANSLLYTAEHKPAPRALWSQEAAHPCLLSFCSANRLSYCGVFLLLSAKSLNVPAPVGGIGIFKDGLVSTCKYTARIPG